MVVVVVVVEWLVVDLLSLFLIEPLIEPNKLLLLLLISKLEGLTERWENDN